MPRPYAFETRDCGRCGGSGHYSYNTMDGTRCYGCRGSGKVLTPKAKKAKKIYDAERDAILVMPASAVTEGMVLWSDGVPGFTASRWRRVLSVRPDDLNPGKIIISMVGLGHHCSPNDPFRRSATPEEVITLDAVMARFLGKGVIQTEVYASHEKTCDIPNCICKPPEA